MKERRKRRKRRRRLLPSQGRAEINVQSGKRRVVAVVVPNSSGVIITIFIDLGGRATAEAAASSATAFGIPTIADNFKVFRP